MKWPPHKAWTSKRRRKGYRHFEVKHCGGQGKERWVELFPLLDKQTRLRVSWAELKTDTEWASGWLQISEGEDCNVEQESLDKFANLESKIKNV